jgi:hypothetical protein
MKKLIAVVMFLPFLSCEKEGETGTGNYIMGVTNNRSKTYNAEVLLDGKFQTAFVIKALTNGASSGKCSDLVGAVNATNVIVLNLVTIGKHTVTLRDESTKLEIISGSFDMTDARCTTQQVTLQ